MKSVPREMSVNLLLQALAPSALAGSKSASSLHLERLLGVSPELEIAPGIFVETVNCPAKVATEKRTARASTAQSVIQDEPTEPLSADGRVNGGCSGDSTQNAADHVKLAVALVNTIGQRLLARRKAAAADIDASPYGKAATAITTDAPGTKKQANMPALRNPMLPGAYSVTATPEQQSQNQAAAQNPVAQATQASTVGPGNTPNANPIGSFGPLAANPGQVTGNAALGVKNNVMKIGAARELAEIFDAKVSNDFWDALGAGFRHVFEHGKQAAIGPYEVVVDRPRGYKKTFQTPRGPEGIEADNPYRELFRAQKQALAPLMPRRKKKPVINNSIASPLLGLGALGAAGIGGAHALAGDEQAANLGRIVGQHELPLAPHETATTRYQSLMSEGAGVAPLGIPAGEIISRVRAQPKLMEAVGIKGYGADRPGSFQEARMHYDAFRKGPIAAYQHQLSAKGMGTQVAPELALTHGVKTYDQLMQPHFTEAFKKWRTAQGGQGQLLEGASGWLEPHEIDASVVPLEAQRDFIRQYHEGLPPALQAERQRVETDLWGPGLKNNEKNYRPVIEGGLGVRNALKTVGMTAGGAATGGILGHYLHKALTGGREEGEVNPGYWAATGLGAAAGGAAGYFGGTPQGREMLARFFKRSNWLDKVVEHPVTPFIARPVIGAGVSLGINELVRLLAAQYVGKPVDPEKKRQDRLIAGAMGAGMGLGKAISPYVESMIT